MTALSMKTEQLEETRISLQHEDFPHTRSISHGVFSSPITARWWAPNDQFFSQSENAGVIPFFPPRFPATQQVQQLIPALFSERSRF